MHAHQTPSLNEQITAINMDVTSVKHTNINLQAIASGNPKRQMAGLRGMGLAPTQANLAYVMAKHGIK
ncbi:hypothetical protein [Mycobacterium avium]|uniref:hypothetical protein n=1 Tax=Mycobacterium avium TaxID=1764 RepID=UPI0026664612|nr:hypothetical protein [Mycobacterium avium]MDO2354664.1 hypothetical protein [Mycobacterium avium subsp. hominissuis]